MTARNEPEKYSAPALSKGLDILEFLSGESRGQKKSDVARALGRSVGEIFRMLVVLEQRGYVAFDQESERYSLTTRLFELAHRHPPIRRLSEVAGEIMPRLAEAVNQSVHMAILDDIHILVIAGSESPGDNVTIVRLGARIPLEQTGSGAVLTADLPKNVRTALQSKIKSAPVKHRRLYRENCQQVLEHGYCASPSMVIASVTNLSAPVRDHTGAVIAALTIPYVERLSTRHHHIPQVKTLDALVEAASHISNLLGGASPA